MLLSGAYVEIGTEAEQPATTATRDGDGWRIEGVKSNVAGASVADVIVVAAAVGDEVGLFLVPTGAGGVSSARQQSMNHEPLFELRLDGVRVDSDALLGTVEQGREALTWALNRVTIAICALMSGVADRASSARS